MYCRRTMETQRTVSSPGYTPITDAMKARTKKNLCAISTKYIHDKFWVTGDWIQEA